MTIQEKVEADALELAKDYYYQYLKHRPARMDVFTSKNGKWWKYFFEAADKFSRRKEWDSEVFIKCQFDKNDIIYPPQLKTDKAWETFLEYKERNKNVTEELELARSLFSGVSVLKKGTMEEFLNNNGNKLRLFNNSYTFDIRAFCFSKTFLFFYEENEEKFDRKIDVLTLKIRVRKYPRLIESLRKRFNEDFLL